MLITSHAVQTPNTCFPGELPEQNLEIRLKTKMERIKRTLSAAATLLEKKGWCIAVIRPILWQWYTHTSFSLQVYVRPNELIDSEWCQTNEVRQREAAGSWHVIFNKHMSFSPITLLLQMEHLTPYTHPPQRSVTHTISNGFFSEFRPMPTRADTHTNPGRKSLASKQVIFFYWMVFLVSPR